MDWIDVLIKVIPQFISGLESHIDILIKATPSLLHGRGGVTFPFFIFVSFFFIIIMMEEADRE